MSDLAPPARFPHPFPRGLERFRTTVLVRVEQVLPLDLFEVGALITLTMIAFSLHETFWYIQMGVVMLTVAGVVVRPLVWNPLLWFGLVGVFTLSYLNTWYSQNNHDFLKVYWCLGVAVALLASDPRRALAWNARVLIGLCFLFATLWKLLSPEYVGGEFFHYFLLQDVRFELLSEHLGGLDPARLAEGRTERILYGMFGDPTAGVDAWGAERVGWISPVLTWWTVAIEGAVAVAFLSPVGRGLSKWRDALLIVFMITTYIIAPILYFAWLLCGMGVVQCDQDRSRVWPLLYLATLALVIARFYVPL